MSNNAAIIRGIYDAFLRGDITAVVAAMDDQIEWNEAEHVTFWRGVPFIGPHAVLTGIFARLPRISTTLASSRYTDTWTAGDRMTPRTPST